MRCSWTSKGRLPDDGSRKAGRDRSRRTHYAKSKTSCHTCLACGVQSTNRSPRSRSDACRDFAGVAPPQKKDGKTNTLDPASPKKGGGKGGDGKGKGTPEGDGGTGGRNGDNPRPRGIIFAVRDSHCDRSDCHIDHDVKSLYAARLKEKEAKQTQAQSATA